MVTAPITFNTPAKPGEVRLVLEVRKDGKPMFTDDATVFAVT